MKLEEWLKETLGLDQVRANREGLASMHNNASFPKTASRDNPIEKELG